jgi:hypothetical protein
VSATAAPLAEQQLELIGRMTELEPSPCFIGGYAEDALLAGRVTRPHVDIDWIVRRSELPLRVAQAAELGFAEFGTWGESAPGEPFYLSGATGELVLELAVVDDQDGRIVVRIRRVMFDIDGRDPLVGYQVVLPDDTFLQPAASIEGIPIRVASPLALYQLRAGIASRGTFGALSERQVATQGQLRQRFFPDLTEAALEPPIERLAA